VNILDSNKAQSMQKSCENQAAKFSEEVFHNSIRRYVLG
jgi:hypothetical protein